MLPVDHRSTAARRYRTCRPISRQGGPAPAGGILLRVDPASGRVAGWLRDPRWVFQDVLADGLRGAWVATTAPELLHVVAALRYERGRPADRATLN